MAPGHRTYKHLHDMRKGTDVVVRNFDVARSTWRQTRRRAPRGAAASFREPGEDAIEQIR